MSSGMAACMAGSVMAKSPAENLITGGGIRLVEDGKPVAVIVIAKEVTEPEKTAAKTLQSYIKKATGAELAIVSPEKSKGKPIIAVGPGAAKAVLPKLNLDKAELGEEGIVIKTEDAKLVVTGAEDSKRGTLYAAYQFLEDELGVRWWTPLDELVPAEAELTVRDLDVRYIPPFLYREAYGWDMVTKENSFAYDDSDAAVTDWDRANFSARQRNNGHATALPASLGGSLVPIGWSHTLTWRFLPPASYFEAHPEWYSEIDGKRIPGKTMSEELAPGPTDVELPAQLCMTNDEMLDELSEIVLAFIRKQPELGMIAVSQMDNMPGCTCPKCKELDDAEGSQSASLLYGVNRVADAVKKEFPDFYVVMLAYQYTRNPPKTIRPRENVLIQVCMDARSFYQPIDSKENQEMADCIKAWSAIGAKQMIWDYANNYKGALALFPNINTIGKDMRFYRDNHAVGVFYEAETIPLSYFQPLRDYVAAQMMWNPSQDERKIIEEFLNGYYGEAGPSLLQAFDLFEKAASDVNMPAWPGASGAEWADLETMNMATELFQKAEAAVANNPARLARVRQARIPLDHQWLYSYAKYRKESDQTETRFLGPKNPAVAAAEFKTKIQAESASMPDHPFKEWRRIHMDDAYLDKLTKRAKSKN